MLLKYLHIKNFKSFMDQEINFEQFSLILGANAAGKSNTIAILRFINNIIKYGLDDAISLSGGIDYTINASIGKNSPVYLKFVLDLSDEKWVKSVEEEEKSMLHLDQVNFEMEIVPHKRGTGYKIGHERLEMVYRYGEFYDKESVHGFMAKEDKLNVIIDRQKNKFRVQTEDEREHEIEKTLLHMGVFVFCGLMEEEAKGKRESMLYHVELIMPPIFNSGELFKIYDFDLKLMKMSSSITSKRGLEEDGSNIVNVLQGILREKDGKRKLLDLLKDALPFIEKIDVQNNGDKSISYRIKENYNDKTFYPNYLSDGTVNMLALILAFYFNESSGIVIVEEPERNLHPQLMGKIVEMAKDVSRDKQIIITTHNPELVKYSELDHVLFVQRNDEGFSEIIRPADSEAIQIFIQNDLDLEDLFVKNMLGE